MPWTFGVIVALLAAAFAAPINPQTSSSIPGNMSQNHITTVPPTDAISIPTSTQNIFGDVISVTPPDAETIELEHLNDDTRFYPDYNDKEVVSHNHFTEPPNVEEPSTNKRNKRQINEYDEMYLEPTFDRSRREVEDEPYRIHLDIPIDSDSGYTILSDSTSSPSTPDVQSTRSPESDHDSLSTQVTYVIISEDDSSPNGSADVLDRLKYAVSEESTTQAIDIAVPSSNQRSDSSESSLLSSSSDSSYSTSSTDSKEERQRVFREIADTIRARRSLRSDNQRYRRRRSSDYADKSSSSEGDTQYLPRKSRHASYNRADTTNYRVSRSLSDTDSDDTEPGDARGLNMQDMSMDGTDLKLLDGVAPLPEYSSEFAELVNPSKTYVDGVLATGADPYSPRDKRSLVSQTEAEIHPHEEGTTTEAGLETTTLSQGLDIVTATYPLGIDATKENLSLPEGNFLGPRVYAKGDLVQEEQPAITGIAAPLEKEQTISVLNGSETETVYSAPAGNLNLPLLIPVVGPTAHPGDEPRIELSLPSGYIPYIIQISPATTPSTKTENGSSQTNVTIPPTAEGSSSITTETTTAQSEVLKFLSDVPTAIVGATTTPSPTTQNEVSNVSTQTYTSSSVPEMLPIASIPTSTKSPSTLGLSSLQPLDSSTSSHSEVIEVSSTTSLPSVSASAITPITANDQPRSSSGDKPISESGISEQPDVSNLSTTKSPNLPESTPNQQTETDEVVKSSAAVQDFTPGVTTQPDLMSITPEIKPEEKAKDQHELKVLLGGIHELASSDLKSSDDAIGLKTGLMTSTTFAPIRNSLPDKEDVAAPPIDLKRTRPGKRFNVIPILERNAVMSPNGSFSYSFRSGNGIQVQESGYLKQDVPKQETPGEPPAKGVAQAVRGSYSYTAPDGRLISVKYVADENGFRAEGNDLPR